MPETKAATHSFLFSQGHSRSLCPGDWIASRRSQPQPWGLGFQHLNLGQLLSPWQLSPRTSTTGILSFFLVPSLSRGHRAPWTNAHTRLSASPWSTAQRGYYSLLTPHSPFKWLCEYVSWIFPTCSCEGLALHLPLQVNAHAPFFPGVPVFLDFGSFPVTLALW